MGGTQPSQEAGEGTDESMRGVGGSADERSSSRKSEEKERSRKQRAVVPTLFRWPYGGNEVFVVGSFNNWKGKVDDSWQYDPQKAKITNRQGKISNLVEIMGDDPDSYGQETPKEFGAEPPALPPQFGQALNFDFSDHNDAAAGFVPASGSMDIDSSTTAASTGGIKGGGGEGDDIDVQDDAHRVLHVQLNHTCSVKRDKENDITSSKLSVLGMTQRYKVKGLHDVKDRFITTLYYKPSNDSDELMAR